MKRRSFFKFIPAAIALPSFETSKPIEKYCVSLKCRSLKFPSKVYSSTQDFWSDHSDLAAKEVNTKFVKFGWLKEFASTSSKLLGDGKSVEIKLNFKSIFHQKIYCIAYRTAFKKTQLNPEIEYYYKSFS